MCAQWWSLFVNKEERDDSLPVQPIVGCGGGLSKRTVVRLWSTTTLFVVVDLLWVVAPCVSPPGSRTRVGNMRVRCHSELLYSVRRDLGLEATRFALCGG